MKIAVWDYLREYELEKEEILDAVGKVFESGRLILGESVSSFEEEFAGYHGGRHCAGVDNGTNALVLAPRALGVDPGSEVITAANTAAPTVVAIDQIGAVPVFVDVRDDYLMDVDQVRDVISPRTTCLLPVHLLVPAKVESGNQGGLPLAPTVQATRSNSSRVHGGSPVPCLEYFQNPRSENVIVDTLQSEQGWWFYQKRNRNVVVWTQAEVEVVEDFCWMTLGQLFHFLDTRDVMNMDSRSVLGCIPSLSADFGAEHSSTDRDRGIALSALSSARTTTDMTVRRIGLNQVWGWHQDGARFHATQNDAPFEIIGVEVEVRGPAVIQWAQPLLRPLREGRFDLVVRRTLGRLEGLFALGGQPGLADIVEFAPTRGPREHGGPQLPELGRTRALYDQVQSEEGGRFYHAMSRYVVRELMTTTASEERTTGIRLGAHRPRARAPHPPAVLHRRGPQPGRLPAARTRQWRTVHRRPPWFARNRCVTKEWK